MDIGVSTFADAAKETEKLRDNAVKRCAGRPPALAQCTRRSRILDAAAAVFCSKGYHATSMDKVAHQSGMSKKTLYQLYPSKQHLFEAVIDEKLLNPKRVPLPGPISLEEQLTSILTAIAEAVLREEHLHLVRSLMADVAQSEDMRQILRNRIELSREHSSLVVWLTRQRDAGVLAISDPNIASRQLFGMSIGDMMLGTCLGCYEMPSKEESTAFIKMAAELFLRATKVAQPPTP